MQTLFLQRWCGCMVCAPTCAAGFRAVPMNDPEALWDLRVEEPLCLVQGTHRLTVQAASSPAPTKPPLGGNRIPLAASPARSTSCFTQQGRSCCCRGPLGSVVKGVPVDWVPVRGRLSMSSYMATILIVYSEPGLRPCSSAVSSSPPGAGNSSWIPSSGLE